MQQQHPIGLEGERKRPKLLERGSRRNQMRGARIVYRNDQPIISNSSINKSITIDFKLYTMNPEKTVKMSWIAPTMMEAYLLGTLDPASSNMLTVLLTIALIPVKCWKNMMPIEMQKGFITDPLKISMNSNQHGLSKNC